MRIDVGGNVAIGPGAGTKAKLEVSGSVNTDIGHFHYFDNKGDGDSSATPVDVSIFATNRVVGSQFNAFSDARIKNIEGRSDGTADLATLRGIEITNFTYKDVIGKGNRQQKKAIAQQVETVYPQAVSRTTNVVPDIYQKAKVKDGWVQLATNLKKGERVRLIGGNNEGIHEVLEVEPDKFRTDFAVDGDVVFVYGREVKDFRAVDYEAIAMLNVSATQQIKKEKDAEVKALQDENAGLKHQLTAMADQQKAQEKRLAALEARDQAREPRLARRGNARNKRPAVAVNAALDLK